MTFIRNQCGVIGLIASSTMSALFFPLAAVAYRGPETTGMYATGVHDFEFTDTAYPSDYAFDAQGRRMMARVWYPVCHKADVMSDNNETATCQSSSTVLGRQREWIEPGEWEAFFYGQPEPTALTDTFPPTNSYLNAPPIMMEMEDEEESFPVVVYSHGYGSVMADNTALMEEIASQGYTVFALASPGYASGVLFEQTMEAVTAFDYPEVFFAVEQEANSSNPWYVGQSSPDPQVRWESMWAYLTGGGVFPTVMPRVVHDQLALVDYLETVMEKEEESLLEGILGNSDGLGSVVYMGFSMGGSAAGIVSQVDPRAVGAINMDGLHNSVDVFGNASRVPLMNIMGNDGNPLFPYYINEFFFEPWETMGSDPDITRVGFIDSQGVGHLDFSDVRHLDLPLRIALAGYNYTVDGDAIWELLADFCVGFINANLKNGDWKAADSFAKYSSVEPIDVSYVAAWWAEQGDEEDEEAPPGLGLPEEDSQDVTEAPLVVERNDVDDHEEKNSARVSISAAVMLGGLQTSVVGALLLLGLANV